MDRTLFLSIFLGSLLIGGLGAEKVVAQPGVGGTSELSYFADLDYDTSIRTQAAAARLSGDGKKVIYVETATGFDFSLSGWLTGREGGWTEDNVAKVYLYDIAGESRRLIYQGNLSTVVADDGYTKLRAIEDGFSVDLDHEGRRAVLAYSSIVFSASAEGDWDSVSNTLKLVVVDTESLAVTEVASFTIPRYDPVGVPLRISADGGTAVLAYVPAATDEVKPYLWGVEWLASSDLQKLVAVPLTPFASAVELNHPEIGDENRLVSSSLASWFFAISADGERVVFHNISSGQVIGVDSDGGNYHQIEALTPSVAAFVAISGDGEVVAYTDRQVQSSTQFYLNDFQGGNPRLIQNDGYNYDAGRLLLNGDGSALLYDTPRDGYSGFGYGFSASSRYLLTNGSGEGSAVHYELLDVNDDFSKVLTGIYYSSRLFVTENPAYYSEPVVGPTPAPEPEYPDSLNTSRLYLVGGHNRLQVDGWMDLGILPGQSLDGNIHIELGTSGRINNLAASLAERATMILPEEIYTRTLDLNKGTIDLFDSAGTRIVSLPLDSQGLSPTLVVGESAFRLLADPDSLSISEVVQAWPQVPANGNSTASALYVAEAAERITVTGNMAIRPLPGHHYGAIEIELDGDDAGVSDLSSAIAAQASFTLSAPGPYSYELNLNQGVVEVRNGYGVMVLSLPVDSQLQTPSLRIGSGAFTRIKVEEAGGGFSLTDLPPGG